MKRLFNLVSTSRPSAARSVSIASIHSDPFIHSIIHPESKSAGNVVKGYYTD